MAGNNIANIEPSLKYILNAALGDLLKYAAAKNFGPTRGSRFMYIWAFSVVCAWNWIRNDGRIIGDHDEWNWTNNKSAQTLNDRDSILWMCTVIDYIMPFFITDGTYRSIYNCPHNLINSIKTTGDWNGWKVVWDSWFAFRQNDGYTTASTTQPTDSANWENTIIVDGITVNDISTFPEPLEWTRLTVQGKKQNYLTHTWDTVLSTCLTEADEAAIEATVSPKTGADRDSEIVDVKNITAALTDEQKIIAEFWAGGPGTVSPPLMFIWLWKEYIQSITSISCPNIIYSLLDLAIHLFEGGRITWRLKAAHMESRPIQEIRRVYNGQNIQSWNGVIDGAQWIPYQAANFITPPFADFPSGHSHFSKAFALTMNKWFGAGNFTKNSVFYDGLTLISPLFRDNSVRTFGDFNILNGMSEIQPGIVPTNELTLSYNNWDDIANAAGLSRLYGGIHCITAHTSSQSVAISVDAKINTAWNIQTS
jgi:hypothetical protein